MEILAGGASPKHQDGITGQLLQSQDFILERKGRRAGDELILETENGQRRISGLQMGVGSVGHNQINLSVFQKIRAADGCLVGDPDPHIGIFPWNFSR